MATYRYEIAGSVLGGRVEIGGAKNAVLPILAATLLNKGTSYIYNVPDLSDIDVAIEILKAFNCNVSHENHSVVVDASDAMYTNIPQELTSKCRATLAFLGASLGRFGEADIAFPGGCVLGPRPVNMHIEALHALGLEVNEDNTIHVQGKLLDSVLQLLYPSVGVTENILIMAATSHHTIIIKNAAREPEIVNLCKYLTETGANIDGAGTSTIIIKGRDMIECEAHISVIPDRIEAATYITAGVMTGRDVEVAKCNPHDIRRLLTILRKMGCEINVSEDTVHVIKGLLDKQLTTPLYIVAKPYPAFPTDMQPLIMPLLCLIASEYSPSILADTVFPYRYMLAEELSKMGAKIHKRTGAAVITGLERIDTCRFTASRNLVSHDLRGGAALILASLATEPGTVSNVYDEGYIKRGYENISEKFSQIGGNVSVKLLK